MEDLKKSSKFSESHNICPRFPNTGDGFDYYETINKLYGLTAEKLYKYMELDFAKSVMFPKDNPEYTTNLEHNVWKSKTTSGDEPSIGARIAVVSRTPIDEDDGVENGTNLFTNLKFTLCYLSHTFMIDIDLPNIRKVWYAETEVQKPQTVSRLFEHDLVDKVTNNIESNYSKDDVSIESMKTLKGVHIVGCVNSIKYPLRDMNLLSIMKNYTDPAYMTKTLLDPTRGFCDKIVEISQPPFTENTWDCTKHLIQARRVGFEYMNNRTPAQRIALFRRVLAENLYHLSSTELSAEHQRRTGPFSNELSTNLAHVLISCVMNTASSAPTKYKIPESEDCQAYVLQTSGCMDKDKRTETQQSLDRDRRPKNYDKLSSRYAVPKPFEEFEVTRVTPAKEDTTIIFNLFQKLLDDCWEYSGLSDRSEASHIFNTDLYNYITEHSYGAGGAQTVPININASDIIPTPIISEELRREEESARQQIIEFKKVCNSVPEPSTYRLPGHWVPTAEKEKIASITRNLKKRIGSPKPRVVRSLADQAAALIPNSQLENPPPDRLNLTDDLGPPVYTRRWNHGDPFYYNYEGAIIEEAP